MKASRDPSVEGAKALSQVRDEDEKESNANGRHPAKERNVLHKLRASIGSSLSPPPSDEANDDDRTGAGINDDEIDKD